MGATPIVMRLVAAERVEEEVDVLEAQVRPRRDEEWLRVHLRHAAAAGGGGCLDLTEAHTRRDEDLHGVRGGLSLVLAPAVQHAGDLVSIAIVSIAIVSIAMVPCAVLAMLLYLLWLCLL